MTRFFISTGNPFSQSIVIGSLTLTGVPQSLENEPEFTEEGLDEGADLAFLFKVSDFGETLPTKGATATYNGTNYRVQKVKQDPMNKTITIYFKAKYGK